LEVSLISEGILLEKYPCTFKEPTAKVIFFVEN